MAIAANLSAIVKTLEQQPAWARAVPSRVASVARDAVLLLSCIPKPNLRSSNNDLNDGAGSMPLPIGPTLVEKPQKSVLLQSKELRTNETKIRTKIIACDAQRWPPF